MFDREYNLTNDLTIPKQVIWNQWILKWSGLECGHTISFFNQEYQEWNHVVINQHKGLLNWVSLYVIQWLKQMQKVWRWLNKCWRSLRKGQAYLFSASVGFFSASFGSRHAIHCHIWFNSPLQAQQGHFPRLGIWLNRLNSLLQKVNVCLCCRVPHMLSSLTYTGEKGT